MGVVICKKWYHFVIKEIIICTKTEKHNTKILEKIELKNA